MWVAHLTLPLALSAKLGLDFTWVLLGSLFPDFLKLYAYRKRRNPRFYPLGITHSALLAFLFPFWFTFATLSFWLGWLIHILLDLGDSIGVMFFYPLSKRLFGFKLWRNTFAKGFLKDMKGYFSQKVPLVLETLSAIFCIGTLFPLF